MKWVVESEGRVLSNIEARVKSTCSRALWSAWYLTSYTMVMTRWGEFPKPIFVVDISKSGRVMWLLISFSGIFGWPSVLRFVEVVCVVTMSSLGIDDRVDIFSLVSWRFLKALTTRALATCCSVNVELIYLMKPILPSWCVLYFIVLTRSCFCVVWSWWYHPPVSYTIRFWWNRWRNDHWWWWILLYCRLLCVTLRGGVWRYYHRWIFSQKDQGVWWRRRAYGVLMRCLLCCLTQWSRIRR